MRVIRVVTGDPSSRFAAGRQGMVGIARRSVLRGVAVAALLPLGVAGVASAVTNPGSGGEGDRRELESAVGRRVRITGGSGATTATLLRVLDLGNAAPGDPLVWSATFRLDDDGGAAVVEGGLVDLRFPGGARLESVGLVLTDPDRRTAVLHVDRRTVAQHLSARHASN